MAIVRDRLTRQRLNIRAGLRVSARLCALALMLCYAGNSPARPNMAPLGPNIADTGSRFYHFSVSTFDSADGKRHYRVWTGVPDQTPPAAGFSILYLLDGNAVMDKLSEPLLKTVSGQHPPVLVAIGYQTPLPFDLTARTYDYTPPDNPHAGIHPSQEKRGRATGGSAAFRQLIEQTIAPAVEKHQQIDPTKRAIWGHSYGGLFILDSFFVSDFFTRYYAASPSLHEDSALLSALAALPAARVPHKQLYLMEGGGDQHEGVPSLQTEVRQAISTMRADGISATYWHSPGLTHGQMFPTSFEAALLHMAKGTE